MDNTIKCSSYELRLLIGEHRSIYGVLLFNKFMNHSFHNRLVNLDFSCMKCFYYFIVDNSVNQKALKVLLDYAAAHKLKFRFLKNLSLEGNDLTDYDIATFCKAVRKGAYKHISTLVLKSGNVEMILYIDNQITELGLLQLCILLEEGYCPKLVEVDIESVIYIISVIL